MEIAVVLFPGFEELDAVGPYEVFAVAAARTDDLTVSTRTLAEADRVTASHGLRVEPAGRLDDVDPDVLVVPGGGWNARSAAGAWAEAERGVLPDAIAQLYDAGATVAGVCTGGMLLARAGLLEGRPAVTHAGATEELADAGANVIDARVVDAGDVLTAGGVTAGLDLALYLLSRDVGQSVASEVAAAIEYDGQGQVFVADES